MSGWPMLARPWYTSSRKPGEWWWPNSSLKMSTQVEPHDGVAACAAAAVPSTPAAPPPTVTSAATAASTLPAMDLEQFLFVITKPPPPA
jgi:hypothetical protein